MISFTTSNALYEAKSIPVNFRNITVQFSVATDATINFVKRGLVYGINQSRGFTNVPIQTKTISQNSTIQVFANDTGTLAVQGIEVNF